MSNDSIKQESNKNHNSTENFVNNYDRFFSKGNINDKISVKQSWYHTPTCSTISSLKKSSRTSNPNVQESF